MAHEALAKWFAEGIKSNIKAYYRLFRALGLPAVIALECARGIVTENLNNFSKRMFYGCSPF